MGLSNSLVLFAQLEVLSGALTPCIVSYQNAGFETVLLLGSLQISLKCKLLEALCQLSTIQVLLTLHSEQKDASQDSPIRICPNKVDD